MWQPHTRHPQPRTVPSGPLTNTRSLMFCPNTNLLLEASALLVEFSALKRRCAVSVGQAGVCHIQGGQEAAWTRLHPTLRAAHAVQAEVRPPGPSGCTEAHVPHLCQPEEHSASQAGAPSFWAPCAQAGPAGPRGSPAATGGKGEDTAHQVCSGDAAQERAPVRPGRTALGLCSSLRPIKAQEEGSRAGWERPGSRP